MINYQTIELTAIAPADVIEIRGIEFEGGYDPTQILVEVIRENGHYCFAKLSYNSGDYYRTGMPFDEKGQTVIAQLLAYCQANEIAVYVGEHGYDVFEDLATKAGFSKLATLKQLATLRKQQAGAVRPLLTLANQTIACSAKVMRFGEKRNSYDEGKTLLLTDVRLQATGELITDHLWTTYTTQFEALAPYYSGEVITFEAKVMPYHKGSYGAQVRDFRMTQFQNIVKKEQTL